MLEINKASVAELVKDMKPWFDHFYALAQLWALRSKDPSTKVGAVLVDILNKLPLGQGYNGFAQGIYDHPMILANREEKYPRMIHAENNCIRNSLRNGADLEGSVMFVTEFWPCAPCAAMIIDEGIGVIVTAENRNWPKDPHPGVAEIMLKEANVIRVVLGEQGE